MLRMLLLVSFVLTSLAAAEEKAVRALSDLDLSKYLGLWYEIASYPGPFQKGCVATQATYSLKDDGNLEVLNECRDKTLDGPWRRAKGKAWLPDKTKKAELKVQFFWPFSSDYWVIDLGPQYDFAVVSQPSRKYLWILSRTRALPDSTYQGILKRLGDNGFDLTKLHKTLQEH